MEMDGQAATKADLHSVEQRLEGKLDAIEQRFEGKLDASEARMLDKMSEIAHDSETRILNALYAINETATKRMLQMETSDAILVSRIGTLESRVADLERRINLPPAS